MSLFYFRTGESSPFNLLIGPGDLVFLSIRNYMSKEWFLKSAFHAEHSDLATRILGILAQEEIEPVQQSSL